MDAEATTARPRPRGTEQPTQTEVTESVLPHETSAEMALLGSMLLDPQVTDSVFEIVDSSDAFFSRSNRIIFSGILELYKSNTAIDSVTLLSTLARRSQNEIADAVEYLQELLHSVPSAANAEYYANIVRDKFMLRKMIRACNDTLKECYQSPLEASAVMDRGEKRIFDVAQQKVKGAPTALAELLKQTFDAIDRNSGDHLTGIATGFVELDNLTSGLQAGEMIVLAARPSVGKTALAMNIVEHVGVDLKRPVGVFSLEMSAQQLCQRMLCSRATVDSHSLRRGMLGDDGWKRLHVAADELNSGRIFIDDTPALTLLDLRAKARRLVAQHSIELLVVDYLQLMEAPREENRQQQISSLSRGIKALARELKCPVICLSQLNRAPENENRMPRTSDLRESGSIEQDADVVLLMHREAIMHRGDKEWELTNPEKVNEAQLIVAKQRNGPCDTIKLTFISGSVRFATLNTGAGVPF
ncbi:MAG TPA: replicative DNA helicase [Phycisphaerae bacterium]|nr:replicative DNA helicase [Phycisphaerae bacterium]